MRIHALAVAFVFLCALPAFAQRDPRMVVGAGAMERDAWSGPITPGSAVQVTNPFGDIRLRHGGSDDNLEVAVVLQQLDTDGSRLELVVDVGEKTVEVRVIRRALDGTASSASSERDLARADLAVLVPEGATVTAETTFGLIEARGIKTDVDLKTVNGGIRVAKTTGRIVAHSDRGPMTVTLEAGVTKQPQSLSTVTSPIEVFAAPTNDLSITMSTSGAFITDYSLAVEHHEHAEPDKTATATIGSGGPVLTISSKRGDLSIRRLVTVDTP